jgi:hypothetical protein
MPRRNQVVRLKKRPKYLAESKIHWVNLRQRFTVLWRSKEALEFYIPSTITS